MWSRYRTSSKLIIWSSYHAQNNPHWNIKFWWKNHHFWKIEILQKIIIQKVIYTPLGNLEHALSGSNIRTGWCLIVWSRYENCYEPKWITGFRDIEIFVMKCNKNVWSDIRLNSLTTGITVEVEHLLNSQIVLDVKPNKFRQWII